METYKLSYDGDKIDETLQLTNDSTKGNEALKKSIETTNNKIEQLQESIDNEVIDRKDVDKELQSNINKKQDKLTEGINISIDSNNVISANLDGYATRLELQEEIDARDAADDKLNDKYGKLDAKIGSEIGRATAVENKLKGRMSTVEDSVETLGTSKQDKLIAGENVTIVNNVISASGGEGKGYVTETQLKSEVEAREEADTTLQSNIDEVKDNYQFALKAPQSGHIEIGDNYSPDGRLKSTIRTLTGSGHLALYDDTLSWISDAKGELNASINKKQDKLTDAQLSAVNSGITSDLVTQIGTNTTNIANKQDKLVAGSNIVLSSNKISAKGVTFGSPANFINNLSYSIQIAVLSLKSLSTTINKLAWSIVTLDANTTTTITNTLAWGIVREGLDYPDYKATVLGTFFGLLIPTVDTSGEWNGHTAGGLYFHASGTTPMKNGLNFPITERHQVTFYEE